MVIEGRYYRCRFYPHGENMGMKAFLDDKTPFSVRAGGAFAVIFGREIFMGRYKPEQGKE